MASMTAFEIVKKLVGPITPLGDHNADLDRLRNLNEMIVLADLIIGEIGKVQMYVCREEASIKQLAIAASSFLRELRESLNDVELP